MSTITVRNLDDEVKGALRERAAANGRSLEEEVRQVLRESVRRQPRPRTGAEMLARIRAIVEPVGGIELEPLPRTHLRKPPDLR
jgi:plasmid stability protein